MTVSSLLQWCFPSRPTTQPLLPKKPVPHPGSPIKVAGCVFCELDSNSIVGDRVRAEEDGLIVFRDRSASARQHLLVIPKGHVATSVKDLTAADVPLLRRMGQLAQRTLEQDGDSTSSERGRFKLGFHIPPLTSVSHIHLHAFELPHSSRWTSIEFRQSRRSHGRHGKGWGWFVELDQTIDILEAGKKVAVRPVHV